MLLTQEDKLLGVNETSHIKILEKSIFTKAYKYEVWTKDKENKSIETGALIDNILPYKEKRKFLEGVKEICYKDTCFRLLDEVKPKQDIKEKRPIEEVNKEIKTIKKKRLK